MGSGDHCIRNIIEMNHIPSSFRKRWIDMEYTTNKWATYQEHRTLWSLCQTKFYWSLTHIRRKEKQHEPHRNTDKMETRKQRREKVTWNTTSIGRACTIWVCHSRTCLCVIQLRCTRIWISNWDDFFFHWIDFCLTLWEIVFCGLCVTNIICIVIWSKWEFGMVDWSARVPVYTLLNSTSCYLGKCLNRASAWSRWNDAVPIARTIITE